LLRGFSWQELRQHPWRNAAALASVMLGVALSFSVHLINASALDEFSQAVRSVNGQPDLELSAVGDHFDEALLAQVLAHPGTAAASPVLELTMLRMTGTPAPPQPLRVIGIDALQVARLAPDLLPRPSPQAPRLAMLMPDQVFLNPSAQALVGSEPRLALRTPAGQKTLQVAGAVMASGPALVVMDIGAVQDLWQRAGQLSRIDLKLAPGWDRPRYLASLDLPSHILAAEPGDAAMQVQQLSRAYRVNLTVLALVALFTGAFLVFSVLSLSVARRSRQLALLGVLGLTPAQRRGLVLAEATLLGGLGSLLGLALGTALAALALQLLGGDLGGGYFKGVAPHLQWQWTAALGQGLLGTAAAVAGAWWPAKQAGALPPAQALKGLGQGTSHTMSAWPGLLLMGLGAALGFSPSVGGIALGAYVAVALLLLGGIVLLPAVAAQSYAPLARACASKLLPLLALERARRSSSLAATSISGIVASLSLAVALTVMVASFRTSVIQWLDQVLPAPLYVRASGGMQAGDVATLGPEALAQLAKLPGVAHVSGLRVRSLMLNPRQPNVALISRALAPATATLPLVAGPLPVPEGRIAIYVSEPMLALYNARLGEVFAPLSKAFASAQPRQFQVAGVWRDYARQSGSIVIDERDYQALSGDHQVNDVAVWLSPDAPEAQVQQAIRAWRSPQGGDDSPPLELASSSEIRANSLRIFDRSFAVTYWLQAVAIGIGLFGVAASFSAQVLARRKEFGLLAHVGFTRRQILLVVAGEGAAWSCVGTAAGLLLGCGVSVLLVDVVNPQSFHWSMDLTLPVGRLAALCTATLLAGTFTAWFAGRAAATSQAVMAVREDW
jgi:putative ABC transport system permease protein